VSGWIGNHQGRELVFVSHRLASKIVDINIALLVASHHHNFHSSHDSRSGIGAMSA
jgi:hypothetical protein